MGAGSVVTGRNARDGRDASNRIRDDVALVILGRTAGEDQDNTDKPGSYKLTRTEED